MKYLLDVNVLLALTWPNHEFHQAAHQWWRASRKIWATCAITEMAFIRLSSNPAFTSAAVTPYEAATLLEQLVSLGRHEYWDELPRVNRDQFRKIAGHKQITDFYLAHLSSSHRAKLATFDRAIETLMGSDLVELIRAK
jgi:toxin-antitoxin system PIN domain toxin